MHSRYQPYLRIEDEAPLHGVETTGANLFVHVAIARDKDILRRRPMVLIRGLHTILQQQGSDIKALVHSHHECNHSMESAGYGRSQPAPNAG